MTPTVSSLMSVLEATAGPDLLDELAIARIHKMHHKRSRLFWERPPGPARAPHYLRFVREQPCAFCSAPAPSEAHHFGPRGVGQKTDDYRAIPLCVGHHLQKHGLAEHEDLLRVREAQVETLVQYLRVVEQK